MKKIDKHRPRHINQSQNPYFITGRTYFGLPYFDTDEKKELALLSAIRLACENYRLDLDGWVVLDNHYHLLFRPPGCSWEIASKLASPDTSCSSNFSCDSFGNSNFSCNSIAGKPASPDGTPALEIALLSAIKNFHVGKVVGTIHGKSSSLLKEIADKSASSNNFRSSDFSRDSFGNSDFSRDEIAGKPASSGRHIWWKSKYWEEIKRRSITLYGERSQHADKRHAVEFRRLLREGTAEELAAFVNKINRVWYQYTDHVIRNESDYYAHLNYIHQNCVKHGYAKGMWGYCFSSIHDYDRAWTEDCFREYPIVDFEPEMGDAG